MTPPDPKFLRWLIDQFRYNPKGFVRHVIRPKVISKDQDRFLDAIQPEGARVSVASGTTTAKTTDLSWAVLWFLSTRAEARVPCTATKYDQVVKTLWPEIAKWRALMIPEFAEMIRFQQEKIYLLGHENSCFAWPMAAAKDRTEGFQGVHAKNVMFIFDEAAGIPQEIFDAAAGSVSTPGARWIIAGNPNRASGPFFNSHHKNAALWNGLTFSSLDSPFCHPDYPKRIAREYGVESNMYRIRVLGKFPKNDPDTLIPFDWVEEAKDREIVPDKSQPRIAGLDPSGGGADSVGFSIRQGTLAYAFDEWPAIEAMPTVGRVKKMWDDHLFDRIVVDALGVGNGVASRLEELGVPVIPVNVSTKPFLKANCYQLRDELWWLARDWFESRIVRIEAGQNRPDDMLNKFAHEVSSPKFYGHSTGKDKVEDKDSLRLSNRLGYSPNIADSFCLTFVQGIPIRNRSAILSSSAPDTGASQFPW